MNLLKKYLSDVKPLSISTGNFVVMLVPALIVLFSTDFMSVVEHAEVQNSMIYIVILGVVGTGIANFCATSAASCVSGNCFATQSAGNV